MSKGENMSMNAFEALYATVENRRINKKEGSYTCYLFEKGLDKILKKIGEESAEVIIAAKNDSVSTEENRAENKDLLCGEIADLMYHLMVMMAERDLPLEALTAELEKRSEVTGNLKVMKTVDKNT